MKKVEIYSFSQLRDYSSLFSRSSALQWLQGNFENIDYKIERYDKKWLRFKNPTYLKYLRHIYSVLKNKYQNEYIYKNEFLNYWIVNELGKYNSKVYNEIRVGNSIADLALFNGTSKVFEIKTGLDTATRLKTQIESYRFAFNYLYLIIPESKVDLYSNIDKGIGIILFTDNQENKFKLYRDALFNQLIDGETVMDILHTNEYKQVVKNYYGNLPNKLTSFNQYNICMDLIKKIPSSTLNELFITALKNRDKQNNLSSRRYKEFNQLSLALDMNKKEKREMIEKLKSPINF